MARKSEIERPYPPDFVTADTLAYRLDCSRSTVDDYVRRSLLPKSVMIGGLPRWYWPDVLEAIRAQNNVANGPVSPASCQQDPFLEAVERGEAKNA
jgi:predicted DNA-binding transcriptional regulator AlpA